MAIAASDIKFKLSVKTGAAGNSVAQADPDESLGKYISTTEVTSATLHALFDVVTGDENAAGTVDYRCIFIHNAHATLSYENVVVWLTGEVSGGAVAAIAVDNAAASAIGAAGAQADELATEVTPPDSVGSFSSPTTKATGLSVGTIPAGYCRAIWIRRTAGNTVALDADGVTINVAGDTAA